MVRPRLAARRATKHTAKIGFTPLLPLLFPACFTGSRLRSTSCAPNLGTPREPSFFSASQRHPTSTTITTVLVAFVMAMTIVLIGWS